MFVFGSTPNSFGQPQKSLLTVASSACTSSPITISYVIASSQSRCQTTRRDPGARPSSIRDAHGPPVGVRRHVQQAHGAVLSMSTATDDFGRRLPTRERHLHLEGSLRLPTIERLARRHGIDVGDRRYLEARYQFSGFEEFLTLFMLGLDVIRTGEDFVDVTEALAVELAGQNVRYAEVTTTAYSHVQRGI